MQHFHSVTHSGDRWRCEAPPVPEKNTEKVIKSMNQNKKTISAFIYGFSVDSNAFDMLPFILTLRPTSGYMAEFLGQVILDIHGKTKSILLLAMISSG